MEWVYVELQMWLGYLKLQLKISQVQIERVKACDSICPLESFHE